VPIPPPKLHVLYEDNHLLVVNKPDAVQTEVRAGHIGIKRNHQDYMALNMTLRILGGEGANRLHQVLRSERGLTYGAKADMDTLLESGDFEASTNTRSEATGEVLRLIVDEFWRIKRERVGERELSDAKAYLTGSFPLTIETPDAIATQVLNVLFYGLPVEQLQSFRDMVNAVKTDDIERVAKYYLQPDRLSIVLVDARHGLLEQSRRHAFIASILRIPHLVFAVNKMDLVDWSEARFREIEHEFRNFAARLDVQDIAFIPVSALTGANVVERSTEMPWYHGPTLLYHLETVHITSDRNLIDVRFPVQWVIRPQSAEHPDYRGYAGQVAGGVLRPGDEVTALPSGLTTKITNIEQLGEPVDAAFAPMSVTVHLADDVDVGRGDMLCRPNNQPIVGQDLDAMICWMTDKPLALKGRYALKHTTRWTRAIVSDVQYRIDVNTGHRDETDRQLKLNDLGRIQLRTTTPIVYDPYRRNRTTGSFILVDETTNATVAAGMLLAE